MFPEITPVKCGTSIVNTISKNDIDHVARTSRDHLYQVELIEPTVLFVAMNSSEFDTFLNIYAGYGIRRLYHNDDRYLKERGIQCF